MPPDAQRSPDDWTGARPLVTGTPVVVGGVVVLLVAVMMVASVGRQPGFVAALSQEYSSMMAGSLTPETRTNDPDRLASALRVVLPFPVKVTSLEPQFVLQGGRPTEVQGHTVAAWMYTSRAADRVLVEVFQGRLDGLGPPDDTRTDPKPQLRLFRKTTQTIAAWQDGALVYAVISTLPTEQVVAIARRLAPSGASSPAS
jgi:anti-sigma factor RsiW